MNFQQNNYQVMVDTSPPAEAAQPKVVLPHVIELMAQPASSSKGLGYIMLSPTMQTNLCQTISMTRVHAMQ